MERVRFSFLLVGLLLTSFAWAGSPGQDDLSSAYSGSSFGDEVAQPDAQWLSINQAVIDESVQAVHAALRAVQKTAVNRLVQFAKDCDQPGHWTRESENVGEAPDALVSFGEAEVYNDGRVPYIVKIIRSDCSGLKTETTTYYYRKDRTLAYTFQFTETYNADSRPIRIESHNYLTQSGQILASYERVRDAQSGQVLDSVRTSGFAPIAYVKAHKLPFYGLLF